MIRPFFKIFLPILAGASLRDRAVAAFGAVVGIVLTALYAAEVLPEGAAMIVAPVGASAVLLFAVPASPLAQPWSIIGGNGVSLLWGIGAAMLGARFGLHPAVDAGLAVAGAIMAMSLLRCLHPPGGAVALAAALYKAEALGPGAMIGFGLPLMFNSAVLVILGFVFHRYSGHSYPHRPVPVMGREEPVTSGTAGGATGVTIADVDKALEDLGETFDVAREDLLLLFEQAERHAGERIRGIF